MCATVSGTDLFRKEHVSISARTKHHQRQRKDRYPNKIPDGYFLVYQWPIAQTVQG